MFLLFSRVQLERFATRSCLQMKWACAPFSLTFQQGTTHTSASSAGAAFEMRARWRATNASTPGRSPMNVTAVGRNSASSTSWKPTTVCTQVLWSKPSCERRCLERETLYLLMLITSGLGTWWFDGWPDKVLPSVQTWWYQTWQPEIRDVNLCALEGFSPDTSLYAKLTASWCLINQYYNN